MSDINILYIYGAGRSGTTLLDCVLGQHGRFFSLGQFLSMPTILERESQICACGERVKDCSFWSPFIDEFESTLRSIQQARSPDYFFARGHRLLELWMCVQFFLFGKLPDVPKDHMERQERILRSISERSHCSWLVDSSKKPLRLLALLRLKNVNTCVIYVIRDGRGFIASKKKEKSARKTGPFLSAISWAYQNFLAFMIHSRVTPENRIMISYEDFIKDPGMQVTRILDKFGITEEMPPLGYEYYDPSATHMPFGNLMRLEGRKKIEKAKGPRKFNLKDEIAYWFFGAWMKRLSASLKD